jgi:hypothetical protein
MKYYTTGHTEEKAKTVSHQMMRVSTGSHIENSGTKYRLPFFKHATRDEWAIQIDTAERVPLILNDDIEYSISVLMGMYQDIMTEQEKADVPNLIRARKASENRKDRYFIMSEILPQGLYAAFKTQEELEADGWFSEVEAV